MNGCFFEDIELELFSDEELEMEIARSPGGGDNDYIPLRNKPQINGVILIGDKLSKELNLQDHMDPMTFQDIDEIIFGE